MLGCNDLPTCSQAPGQERPGCYLLPGPLSAPVDFQKGLGQSLGSQGNRDQWGLCGRCPEMEGAQESGLGMAEAAGESGRTFWRRGWLTET